MIVIFFLQVEQPTKEGGEAALSAFETPPSCFTREVPNSSNEPLFEDYKIAIVPPLDHATCFKAYSTVYL